MQSIDGQINENGKQPASSEERESYLQNELKRLKAAAPKYQKPAAKNPLSSESIDPVGRILIEPNFQSYNELAAPELAAYKPAASEPAVCKLAAREPAAF